MLPPHPEDTIVAISTPPGRGGIGVIRLSGSASTTIAQRLTNRQTGWLPRHATVAPILDRDGQPIDQAVVTWFQRPNSYTAEDVVEIACHGAPVVLGFVVERAIQLGARLAEPGEFTQRAFLNGRLDLTQAEAVRDLIDATTLYQARVALQQVEGALSRRMGPIKHQLRELIALLEAGIDFAEDDISIPSDEAILERLDPVAKGFRDLANSFQFGKIVRGGLTLAIIGRPNVGKSSLFNRLLEQDRAIVAESAGTTRDTISEYLSIEGLPLKLIDTAGIRATTDIVESKGVEKSYEALAGADLILAVLDLSSPLEAADRELLARIGADPRTLVVGTKSDLPRHAEHGVAAADVSAATGAGIAGLRRAIYERAAAGLDAGRESGFVTNIRHERLLNESVEYLEKAREALGAKVPHEMLLLDLYSALRPIDAITGETTVEDILGTIFSTFCIGK